MKKFDYYLSKKTQESLLNVLNHALYCDGYDLSYDEFKRLLNLRIYLLKKLQDEA